MDPFNALDKNEVLNFFNHRPIPPNAYIILFVGDSLTCHGPKVELWDHYSGMAASTYEKDFIHLFTAEVQKELGERPVEILIYATRSIQTILEQLSNSNYNPDLVIFQGGENDPFDDAFRQCYKSLITYYKRNPLEKKTDAIVLGDWYNREKSDFDRQIASEAGYPFIDLFSIQELEQNKGDGGRFNHPGVASHPNDSGMKSISENLVREFRTHILPDIKK